LTRIALTGKMGSGKSTAAKFLEEYGFRRFSFAAKLKEIAKELFGVEGKDRLLLQMLGESLRKIDIDVWARYLIQQIEVYCAVGMGKCRVVVDDLRYLNEARILRAHGFVLVRLICLDEKNRIAWLKDKGTLAGIDHSSETEQDQIQVDLEIRWRTLPDLKDQITGLARVLTGRLTKEDVAAAWKIFQRSRRRRKK